MQSVTFNWPYFRNMRTLARKAASVYVYSAVVIFAFAAIAKLTAPYTADELKLRDPFFSFLTVEQLLDLSAGSEGILVGLLILKGKTAPRFAVRLTLWFAMLFLLYRFGVMFSPDGTGAICKCFGGPGGIIGKYSDGLAWSLLGYLIGVGGLLLVAFAFCESPQSHPPM